MPWLLMQHLALPVVTFSSSLEREIGQTAQSGVEHPPAAAVPLWYWFSLRRFCRAGPKSRRLKIQVFVPFCALGCLLKLCYWLSCEPWNLWLRRRVVLGWENGNKRDEAREIWSDLFKSTVGFLSFFCPLEYDMQPVNAYMYLLKTLLWSQFAL